jgi:predicted anti-sigma-YlaC factor YlaD
MYTKARPAMILAALLLSACSPKKYAMNKVADALAGTGTTFTSDDDSELIRGALPFSLKMIESVLAENPRHEGLLLAATHGFAQYAYAFVQMDADEIEDKDRAAAAAMRLRAAKLYVRARNYGLRGLEVRHKDFIARIKTNPKEAVKELKKSEVPLMYWTALSWAAAISVSHDLMMLPEIPRFEALADRVIELDDAYDEGAIHGFMIIYEMSRLNPRPDRMAIARAHFDRNMALCQGHQAGPLVAYAENVLVPQKNKDEFESMLRQALKIDVNTWPEHRQLNLVMQRRARWLLSRTDKLFPAKS